METAPTLTLRLEAYLMQLSGVNERWTQWLEEKERAVLKLDASRIESLTADSQRLMDELREMLSSRSAILEDANSAGFAATDLQRLAKQLPAWERTTLRNAVRSARAQLANLRRLHAAAWVLIHESAQYYAGTMSLLVQGRNGQHVYVSSPGLDTGGGQLLDANL